MNTTLMLIIDVRDLLFSQISRGRSALTLLVGQQEGQISHGHKICEIKGLQKYGFYNNRYFTFERMLDITL